MIAAENVTLIELPTELLVEIICGWIDLKSLVKMDSAACNNKIRSALLQLFASSHCVFASAADISDRLAVVWFCSRKLQVSSLCLRAYVPELVMYFRSHSRRIRHLICTVSESVNMVGLYLRNLDTLTFRIIVVRELSDILCLNSNFQELCLESVCDLNVKHFDGLRLSHLRVLSLHNTRCNDKMLGTIVRTTEVLQKLEISHSEHVTDAGVIAVAQHCPQLRTIGLCALNITDSALALLVELCPSISCVNLSANSVISDLGVRVIAEKLQHLSRISISNCKSLTDASLEHLTHYSALTLQVLRTIGLPTVRVDVLVALLQKCSCLHTLSLDCDLNAYHADVIPHMRNLQTLITYAVLSDGALCMIAQHNKRLHRLGIYSIYMYIKPADTVPVSTYDTRVLHRAGHLAKLKNRTYTEKGLLALLAGLPQLRVLAVHEQEIQQGLLSPLAQGLWRRVRPQISFEVDRHYFAFDCLANH